jgi:hypothetical protein
MIEQLTAMQFIDTRFIRDMDIALRAKLRYYVCPLICQAIEIMGAFYDTQSFDTFSKSKARFTKGLSRLFVDSRYAAYADDLFGDFRGSMIHQLRPGANVVLTSSDYDGARRSDHLTMTTANQYYIVVEQLFDDFKKAFESLQIEVKANNPDIDQTKVANVFFQYGSSQTLFASASSLINDGMYSRTPPLSGR